MKHWDPLTHLGHGASSLSSVTPADTRVWSVKNGNGRTFHRDVAYAAGPVLSDVAAPYTPGVSERTSDP